MTRYQALLLDIDGTLVGSTRQVTPRVSKAIFEAKQRVTVALASSRSYMNVREYAIALGLDTPQIADAGARIFNPITGQSVWRCPLREEDARAVATHISQLGYSLSAVDGDSHVTHLQDIHSWELTFVAAVGLDDTQANKLKNHFLPSSTLRGVIVPLQNSPLNLNLVEFTHAHAGKGQAALHWAKLAGCEASEIIAIGDTYNDLSLLEVCGLKVAMANGSRELQELADLIAPSVEEDGVAWVIDNLILGEE